MTRKTMRVAFQNQGDLIGSKAHFKRVLIVSSLVIISSAAMFMRLSGTENIRPIHAVTLISCGMGFGILTFSVVSKLRDK